MRKFTTTTGATITVRQVYRGSVDVQLCNAAGETTATVRLAQNDALTLTEVLAHRITGDDE